MEALKDNISNTNHHLGPEYVPPLDHYKNRSYSLNWKTQVVKSKNGGKLLQYRIKSAPLTVLSPTYKNTITTSHMGSHNTISDISRFTNTNNRPQSSISFIEMQPYQKVYKLYCIEASPAFRPHVKQTFTMLKLNVAGIPHASLPGSRSLSRKNSSVFGYARSNSSSTFDGSQKTTARAKRDENILKSMKSMKNRQMSSPSVILERRNSTVNSTVINIKDDNSILSRSHPKDSSLALELGKLNIKPISE